MTDLPEDDRELYELVHERIQHAYMIVALLEDLKIRPACAKNFISAERFSMMCCTLEKPKFVFILPARK